MDLGTLCANSSTRLIPVSSLKNIPLVSPFSARVLLRKDVLLEDMVFALRLFS